MVPILISACLVADPGVYKDHRIPLMRPTNEIQCTFFAQHHFASWRREHPNWKIVGWRCIDSSEDDI